MRLLQILRICLALTLIALAANGFLEVLPNLTLASMANPILGGWNVASYFFPTLNALTALMGICLLTNSLVPVAVVVLVPALGPGLLVSGGAFFIDRMFGMTPVE